MTYRFGDFELDAERFELRCGGEPVAAEPQVLALPLLLARRGCQIAVVAIWAAKIASLMVMRMKVAAHAKTAASDENCLLLVTGLLRSFSMIGEWQVRREESLLALRSKLIEIPEESGSREKWAIFSVSCYVKYALAEQSVLR